MAALARAIAMEASYTYHVATCATCNRRDFGGLTRSEWTFAFECVLAAGRFLPLDVSSMPAGAAS